MAAYGTAPLALTPSPSPTRGRGEPRLPRRIYISGIPRIIPLKNKAHNLREFIAVDPGGNWIRIGQVLATSNAGIDSDQPDAAASKLAKATHAAALLDRARHYDRGAAALDAALARHTTASDADRMPALLLRAALALNMGQQHAREFLDSARRLVLRDADRQQLHSELERLDELAAMLE